MNTNIAESLFTRLMQIESVVMEAEGDPWQVRDALYVLEVQIGALPCGASKDALMDMAAEVYGNLPVPF